MKDIVYVANLAGFLHGFHLSPVNNEGCQESAEDNMKGPSNESEKISQFSMPLNEVITHNRLYCPSTG